MWDQWEQFPTPPSPFHSTTSNHNHDDGADDDDIINQIDDDNEILDYQFTSFMRRLQVVLFQSAENESTSTQTVFWVFLAPHLPSNSLQLMLCNFSHPKSFQYSFFQYSFFQASSQKLGGCASRRVRWVWVWAG